VETSDGVPLPVLKTLSHCLSESINGQPTAPARIIWPPSFQKKSEINDPSPAQLLISARARLSA